MKSSNIGGQAVLEGIMMKNGPKYAVAVRKPDGEIEVKKDEYKSIIKWEKLTKIPFVRGVFNFVDSLVLGMKTLTYSASFLEALVSCVSGFVIAPMTKKIKSTNTIMTTIVIKEVPHKSFIQDSLISLTGTTQKIFIPLDRVEKDICFV